ncbi:hypothetical protein SSX86_017980 [Deinandra increscens subsp. villosa]|uniref:Uncharacterized protein n=1 Tax=Deinandra increscens subsp. villosa TaxID=3103831 RepID=A0AAP0GUR8_9ASTR
MNQAFLLLLSHVAFLFLLLTICTSSDTISVYQNITDGDTIVSRNEKFELGFFSPGSSTNRYLGIWFKNTSPHAVIWVANRETPLSNTLGMVTLNNQGILSVVTVVGTTIWSSNSFVSFTNFNSIAQLMDNGNLVIKYANSVIWQSFDYPGDTFISGMKLGKNLITGREMYLTSWRSADDPSTGEYTVSLLTEEYKYPQVYIKNNYVIETRIGPYDGIEFAGLPNYKHNPDHMYMVDMVVHEKEKYFQYTSNLTTFSLKSTLNPSGKVEISQLDVRNHKWMSDHTMPIDYCDNYGLCGPFGSCSTSNSPTCECLKGFELQNPNSDNWTSGCKRTRALDCGRGEGFFTFSSMKLPDTQNAMLPKKYEDNFFFISTTIYTNISKLGGKK